MGVLLLQEPHVGAGACLVASRPLRVVQRDAACPGKPVRAAVVVAASTIRYIVNARFVTEDMVGVVIEVDGIKIGVISVYFDKLLDLDHYLVAIRGMVASMGVDKIVLGGDVNARSFWWGCETEDVRGPPVAEALAEAGLEVLNRGSVPTFHVWRAGHECASIIGVTADGVPGRVSTRIFKDGHGVDVVARAAAAVELDQLAERYTACTVRAADRAILRLREPTGRRPCKWWTPELRHLKAEVNK